MEFLQDFGDIRIVPPLLKFLVDGFDVVATFNIGISSWFRHQGLEPDENQPRDDLEPALCFIG
jgi:hypothetical protein